MDEDQIERPEAAVLYLAASSQTGECSRERLFEAHRPRGGSPPPDDPKTAMPSFQKWGRTPLSASPRFYLAKIILFPHVGSTVPGIGQARCRGTPVSLA